MSTHDNPGTLCVFDIQRYALHDGPGIRTTVFLKGCPLDCVWCHNPESKSGKPQLSFLGKNCVSCGACAAVCASGVHTFEDGVHRVAYDWCIACGACVDACTLGELKIYGSPMTVDAIMDIVLKDRDYYRNSGGGLTVSGGEPMFQFEGLARLLKRAREEDIHTCLDTSGHAGRQQFEQVLPLVDCLLFDYKITNEAQHRQYTGVSNQLILSNLDYLAGRDAFIMLRCPIIPGINDNEAHLKAIAGLSRRHSAIREVNLMVYHDMGKSKARQTGDRYGLEALASVDTAAKKELYRRLEALSCRNLK